jgi:hypothetical protein
MLLLQWWETEIRRFPEIQPARPPRHDCVLTPCLVSPVLDLLPLPEFHTGHFIALGMRLKVKAWAWDAPETLLELP